MSFELGDYKVKHGTASGYRKGCRCDACRKAHTSDARERRHRQNGVPVRKSAPDRFWVKVHKTNDCWYWTASLDSAGYGLFRANGRMNKAHRYAYELLVAPIPAGLTIDHLCRVRTCVNPDHLEAVTQQENTARARKSHCIRGHEFTKENTYWSRSCRACWNVRKREGAAA